MRHQITNEDIGIITKLGTVSFRRGWVPLFTRLNDEDAGKLVKSICNLFNGVEDHFDDETLELSRDIIATDILWRAKAINSSAVRNKQAKGDHYEK